MKALTRSYFPFVAVYSKCGASRSVDTRTQI